jgi:CarD family transcriptional regulator
MGRSVDAVPYPLEAEMSFRIGQKVSYPNHGVCKIEKITRGQADANPSDFYSLRVLANNSVIHVPTANARSIGVRPVINSLQCRELMEFLAEDFEEPASDWKNRTREFGLKFQTGDIFDAADVLKKLAFLARSKKLSFREQRMFERARFLVVSELAVVCSQAECQIEEKVDDLLKCACEKHQPDKARTALTATATH